MKDNAAYEVQEERALAPAAVHAGIFLATERGYDEAEGVELEVRRPGGSPDVARRLETLGLRVRGLEASTLIELTAFGTAVMMNYRYGGALDAGPPDDA